MLPSLRAGTATASHSSSTNSNNFFVDASAAAAAAGLERGEGGGDMSDEVENERDGRACLTDETSFWLGEKEVHQQQIRGGGPVVCLRCGKERSSRPSSSKRMRELAKRRNATRKCQSPFRMEYPEPYRRHKAVLWRQLVHFRAVTAWAVQPWAGLLLNGASAVARSLQDRTWNDRCCTGTVNAKRFLLSSTSHNNPISDIVNQIANPQGPQSIVTQPRFSHGALPRADRPDVVPRNYLPFGRENRNGRRLRR